MTTYQKLNDLKFMMLATFLGSIWLLGWWGNRTAEPLTLEDMCLRGHGEVCLQLGYAYQSGDGVEADPKESLRFFERACKNEVWSGCVQAGQVYASDEDVRVRSMNRAISFYKQACSEGEVVGCYHLGQMQWAGEGARANEFLAVEYFSIACESRHLTSCFYLAVAHSTGRGVREPDPKLAASLFEIVCEDGSAEACFNLGRMVYQGTGVEADRARAMALFQKACDGEMEQACVIVQAREDSSSDEALNEESAL